MHRLLVFVSFLIAAQMPLSADTAGDEQRLWELEHAYWRYVENNDLASYSNLWHQDFLGWPSISAAPVHKDHITDWITSQTSRGFVFKTGEFKPAALKVTDDVAFVCYWITFHWLDKEGKPTEHRLRITHAWVRSGKDWLILGGMSMPEAGKQ